MIKSILEKTDKTSVCCVQYQDTNNQELTTRAVPVVCLLTGRVIIDRGGSGPARRAGRPASISQVTPEKKLSLFP